VSKIRESVVATDLPSPSGPLAHGVATESLVFVSGQTPVDPETGQIPAGISEQTRLVVERIGRVLNAAGASWEGVVRVSAFLSSMDLLEEFNVAYRECVPEPYPARITVGAELRGILVEMDAIAVRVR
jgi:2-iminobutanoate/2-iminopropanoate deaminase